MSAIDEMQSIASMLRTQGHEVALPDVDGEIRTKAERIRTRFEKVAWAELILICNPEKRGIAGYIGANTFLEMGVSFFQGKQVVTVYDLAVESPFIEELRALQTRSLGGDLIRL